MLADKVRNVKTKLSTLSEFNSNESPASNSGAFCYKNISTF
jgi:hypothetical protein